MLHDIIQLTYPVLVSQLFKASLCISLKLIVYNFKTKRIKKSVIYANFIHLKLHEYQFWIYMKLLSAKHMFTVSQYISKYRLFKILRHKGKKRAIYSNFIHVKAAFRVPILGLHGAGLGPTCVNSFQVHLKILKQPFFI